MVVFLFTESRELLWNCSAFPHHSHLGFSMSSICRCFSSPLFQSSAKFLQLAVFSVLWRGLSIDFSVLITPASSTVLVKGTTNGESKINELLCVSLMDVLLSLYIGCCGLPRMACCLPQLSGFGRRGELIELNVFSITWIKLLTRSPVCFLVACKVDLSVSWLDLCMQYGLELVLKKNFHDFVHEYSQVPDFADLMRKQGALGDPCTCVLSSHSQLVSYAAFLECLSWVPFGFHMFSLLHIAFWSRHEWTNLLLPGASQNQWLKWWIFNWLK